MIPFDQNTIDLIENKDIIIQTNSAFEAVEHTFQLLHQQLRAELKPKLPIKSPGKVSKGQRYRGLPYIVSDLPNHFKKNDIFCFRTMFWWGNELSYSIYLSGESLERHKETALHFDIPHYFCVNNTLWEYHFKEDNYVKNEKLSSQQKEDLVGKNGFIKIANKIPLKDIVQLEKKALTFYNHFLDSI